MEHLPKFPQFSTVIVLVLFFLLISHVSAATVTSEGKTATARYISSTWASYSSCIASGGGSDCSMSGNYLYTTTGVWTSDYPVSLYYGTWNSPTDWSYTAGSLGYKGTSGTIGTGNYVLRNGDNAMAVFIQRGGTNPLPINVTAAFTANQTSGYVPLSVQFTDQSTGSPAVNTWGWAATGDLTSSEQNPVFTFTSSGDKTVVLTASNGDTSDIETKINYIHVDPLPIPLASFSCSPLEGSSPLTVSCSDSSEGFPDSWHWTFSAPSTMDIEPGGVSGSLTIAQNYTANPQLVFTGSGDVDVNLQVTNPAGSDSLYKENYITISGDVPTPTPTPSIPWPNQTGVCWHSSISLGSQQTRDHIEHGSLTDPQGDTYAVNYPIGMVSIITGQPFFTALLGQYYYQETNYDTGVLEWRQSYVVEDCTVTPTVTQTYVYPTPTTIYTIPSTFSPTSIPTGRYTIPPTGVPTYPTITMIPIMPTYATIAPIYSGSDLYNFTIETSPLAKPLVDWMKFFIDNIYFGTANTIVGLILSPVSFGSGYLSLAITQIMSLMLGFASFTFLFVYAIIIMIRNMPDKVVMVFALLLWVNIIKWVYDKFKRGGY